MKMKRRKTELEVKRKGWLTLTLFSVFNNIINYGVLFSLTNLVRYRISLALSSNPLNVAVANPSLKRNTTFYNSPFPKACFTIIGECNIYFSVTLL